MDLTQLANLGEFVGGVAVLATLVYLALQVCSTAANSRYAARESLAQQNVDYTRLWMSSPDYARLHWKEVP